MLLLYTIEIVSSCLVVPFNFQALSIPIIKCIRAKFVGLENSNVEKLIYIYARENVT